MSSEPARRTPLDTLREFLRLEAAGGVVLVCAAVTAMIWANSAAAPAYFRLLDVPLTISAGTYGLSKPLLLWVNDGLMAVFFLLVGLEIKREVLEGQLASLRQVGLPAIAAAGGMLVPALVYVAFNANDAALLRGWAIPTATDIAFALGVLALVGPRVPISLRIFLLALAIIDDLGAIVIIALFYTEKLSLGMLGLAAIALAALAALNLARIERVAAYVLLGVVLWVCVLKSGVHATLAGVAVGFAVPLKSKHGGEHSPLKHLGHALHPWVTFAIMPAFALANAGVAVGEAPLGSEVSPLTLGIALGLFAGKQLGVFAFSWLAIRSGWGQMPQGATWTQLYGVAVLTGIGFTMSLFIGTLAFDDAGVASGVRIGVLAGSLSSAVVGYCVLRFAPTGDR